MRATAVVLVLFLAACGDDGPSKDERVAAVCDAWQAALDESPDGKEATSAKFDDVALDAMESDSQMVPLGLSLLESLHPFDQDAFIISAAGFEEECG